MALRSTLFARIIGFGRDQDGSGSALPLLMLTALLGVAGFAIDTANLWRGGEEMRATADVAAHAGAVALARGNGPTDAIAMAEEAIGLNMDPAIFAPGRNKPRSDLVRLWHYDSESGALSETGEANAVSVQIRRGREDANALRMYVLSLIGLGEVTAKATSVVALTPTTLCGNASGLFSRQNLTLEGEADVGSGFCLHSQRDLTLDHQVRFEAGSGLSMPDLARCDGHCSELASPGFRRAAAEANFVARPLRDHIASTMVAMLAPMADNVLKSDFFATRPIASDLEALAELGVDTSGLATGSVVHLSVFDFEMLREVPQGLVYAIDCDPASPEAPPVLEVGGGMNFPAIDNLVLLTDCALHFPNDIEVAGSLVISSYEGNLPTITADPWAVVGDPALTCAPEAQSQVMALGDQVLPAGLLLSNAAFVLDGAVTLLRAEEGALATHRGLALHASGAITVEGNHAFAACDQPNLTLLPSLNVLRFVMPGVPAMPIMPMNSADMPGKKVKPLSTTPALPMSKLPPQRPDGLLSQADLPEQSQGL